MMICVSRQIGGCHVITRQTICAAGFGCADFLPPRFLNYFAGRIRCFTVKLGKKSSPHRARSKEIAGVRDIASHPCRSPFVATLKTSGPGGVSVGELLRGASSDN